MKRISCNYKRKGSGERIGKIGLLTIVLLGLVITPVIADQTDATDSEITETGFDSLSEEKQTQIIGAVAGLVIVIGIIILLMKIKDKEMP